MVTSPKYLNKVPITDINMINQRIIISQLNIILFSFF